MNWWQMLANDAVRKLDSNVEKGLTSFEVKKRMLKYGKNTLQAEQKDSFLKKLWLQLSDFMIVTLLVAAAVSFFSSFVKGSKDYIDALIILFIVVLNIVIGILQESRAEKAIDSLKKLSSPSAKVLRDSKGQKVRSEELVPGDILILKAGDYICADARVCEASGFFVEESALTGESFSIPKSEKAVSGENLSLGDMKSMVFSGTIVTRGHAKAIVTETGMNTQVGKIAGLMSGEQNFKTPLSKKLEKTGKRLGIFIILICILVFVLGMLQNVDFVEMLMISISLAVAAIPEGLPAVVTIVLATGVRRMAARNTIVRNLPAVETLGHTAVICSDKTGTLTMNKMEVKELRSAFKHEDFKNNFAKKILKLGMLCNNCIITGGNIKGEPTEKALLTAGMKIGLKKANLEAKFKRVFEIPFNSSRKLMTTVHETPEKSYISVTKGAPDIILKKCKFYKTESGICPLTEEVLRKIKKQSEEMSGEALRLIAIAFKDLNTFEKCEETLENELVFCGLAGIEDPVRPEAKLAVKKCKKAGIKPVIITGDHALTAKAIGKEIGILDENSKIITGPELEELSDEKLAEKIETYSIFARVSPQHKMRIIKALQKKDLIVAMTGDGVNDAPALKAADIGCAMGKHGTDAAKAASDMIITDDNFATIVEAIKQGRGMFENIKKTIHFLLSTNIGEVMVVLFGFLIKVPTPLLAVHLLWINMVTDAFPALALGASPIEPEIMKRKPIGNKKGFFSGSMIYNIIIEGLFIAAVGFLSYTVGRVFFDVDPSDPVIGRTMAFTTLGLSQLMHAFNVQSEKSLFETGIFENLKLVYSVIFCIFLQIISVAVPAFNGFFKTICLSLLQWIIVTILAVSPILVSEAEKRFLNPKEKNSCEE